MTRTTVFLLLCVCTTLTQQQLLESMLKFLSDGMQERSYELPDRITPLPAYDFIVVGAGTAGCTVAGRLSENPNWKILLIEAGGPENLIMDIPVLANYLQFFNDINWRYKTEPSNSFCLGMDNHQCKWPRGKVIGGSSVLNYMIHTRGHRKDYDTWRDMGNPGWGYDDVLPYFMKMEDFHVTRYMNSSLHQTGGPVGVSYAPFHTQIASSIVRASQEAGMNYVDYNGDTQEGVSYLQASLKDGTRSSASRGYLYPAKARGNLHVTQRSMVKKVLIDPNTMRAYGVEYVKDGRIYRVRASKEVIISGGTINSAQLLMLSGIGPNKHLKQVGIPVLKNLRVGYNLQDHIAAGGLTFTINKAYSVTLKRAITQESLSNYLSKREGPLAIPGGCEVISYSNLKDPQNPGFPDLELLYMGGSIVSDPVIYKNFGIRDDIFNEVYGPILEHESFMVFPMLLRPRSKGRIVLRNSDYRSKPMIFPNYLAEQEDVDTIVAGIRLALNITQQPALRALGAKLHSIPIPDCARYGFGSDKYWECHTRTFTFTIYHHAGTCKMGPKSDREAVVDPRLRVHGTRGLRVIDASIMPKVPSAHTNVPVFMLAEKGADLIKQDWGYRI